MIHFTAFCEITGLPDLRTNAPTTSVFPTEINPKTSVCDVSIAIDKGAFFNPKNADIFLISPRKHVVGTH